MRKIDRTALIGWIMSLVVGTFLWYIIIRIFIKVAS
jgi:hypothetical protein